MIATDGKYMPRYGYVEARIEFDGSPGMWSSFWMQSDSMSYQPPPTGNPAYTPYDPHRYGTEIDIVEHRSVNGYGCDISSQGTSSLLWDGYAGHSPGAQSAGGGLKSGVGDLSGGFHTYGLEWTPDVQRFYYDDILVWTVNNLTGDPPGTPQGGFSPPCYLASPSPSVDGPVSNTNEYFILSSEVLNSPSTSTPPSAGWCGSIPVHGYGTLGAPDPSETKMIVDYVRHYRETTPPADVTNLSATTIDNTTMPVSWTAPTDNFGTIAEYDLRYSTSPITDFNAAARIATPPPHSPGYSECLLVTGLTACTTYYFAIKTRDDAGNWSGVSNAASAPTLGCGQPASRPGRTAQVAAYGWCGQGAPPAPVTIEVSSLAFSAPSPNPARGATSFRISVPAEFQGAKLRVDVFDVGGRRVRSLVDRTASQGQAQVEWNLLNDSGQRVASGLYVVRVDIGDTRKTLPLLVIR
jgi:hypothetical protein